MKIVKYLQVVLVSFLFIASSLYAENNGTLGSSSKASATITLVIPAYVFQNKVKSFDFNYDEPYQITTFANGHYKVVRSCNGSCTPIKSNTARVIIFEPI